MKTKRQAIKFLQMIIEELGQGFHPDTKFEDYVKPDGSNFYGAREADYNNNKMRHCFKMLGDDVYSVCYEIFKKKGFINI